MSDIFERTFGILEFSQKTNKRIRFYYYDDFFRSFFGRIRGQQKVLLKLSDLYSDQHVLASREQKLKIYPTSRKLKIRLS